MLFIILVFFIVIKGLNDANLISDSEEIKSISGVCLYYMVVQFIRNLLKKIIIIHSTM
jgi:hypothetical protein